jgi:hypothetical protein
MRMFVQKNFPEVNGAKKEGIFGKYKGGMVD